MPEVAYRKVFTAGRSSGGAAPAKHGHRHSVSAAGNPAKMRFHRLFMAVAPFSQRIQRGSQIGGGNGSVEKSVDQSILPDDHHPVCQLRIAVFITQQYEFAVHETTTISVIENVKNFKSEIGVLYENDFNEKVLNKMFKENGLEFVELFSCDTFVYLWSGHPLAKQDVITMEELDEYPCLSFDQGKNNSLYLAEEMKSTYEYRRLIKANDRATLLNLMIGLNAYTLCSGIICEDLNGDDYKAVPLKETEKMRIGYIKRKGAKVSHIGELYIEELKKYKEKVM